jgi:hypothetical protein
MILPYLTMKKLFLLSLIAIVSNNSNAEINSTSNTKKDSIISSDSGNEKGRVPILISGDSTDQYRYKYPKVWILSPNVGIPAFRANIITKGDPNSTVKVSAFNSVSLGLSLSGGSIYSPQNKGFVTKDDKFKNTAGFGLGLLIAFDGKSNSGNVFAPVINVTISNFQLFYGYDFGYVEDNFSRSFVGISYGIPISRLFNSDSDILLTKLKDGSKSKNNKNSNNDTIKPQIKTRGGSFNLFK